MTSQIINENMNPPNGLGSQENACTFDLVNLHNHTYLLDNIACKSMH